MSPSSQFLGAQEGLDEMTQDTVEYQNPPSTPPNSLNGDFRCFTPYDEQRFDLSGRQEVSDGYIHCPII